MSYYDHGNRRLPQVLRKTRKRHNPGDRPIRLTHWEKRHGITKEFKAREYQAVASA